MQTLQPNPTFCGVPYQPDPVGLEAEVAILGAAHGTPYRSGRPSHAANAPGAIRRALGWYSANPEHLDFDTGLPVFGANRVVDCGDVVGSLVDGAANRAAIREATGAILGAGVVPLLLGGDDSTPIPFLEAFGGVYPDLTVVQIDAHIDWRHQVDGVTHGYSSTMRRASEMAHVRHIVQLGARGPGSARQAELDHARAWGARIFSARDLHRDGVAPALAAVPEGAPVVISLDVDGLDPALVPGVILPAFGGIQYQQALDIIHGVAARGRIVGTTAVEYVPERDSTGSGAQAVARLLSNVIAMLRSGTDA